MRITESKPVKRGTTDRSKPTLLLLYGRTRVGKTRLIQEFIKSRKSLYFYVPNAEEKTILTEFSKVAEKEFFAGFRFEAFGSLMEYLTKKCLEGYIVVLDKFQRLSNIDAGFSLIQEYWDERLSASACVTIALSFFPSYIMIGLVFAVVVRNSD